MVTLMIKFMIGICSTVGGDGSPLWARTIKPCNRYKPPSQREDQKSPCRLLQSHHPLLLSAMDPRRSYPQAPHSCRPATKAVLDISPLSPALLRSTFLTPNRQPGQQNGYEFGDESYIGNQTYDRTSPMVSTIQNVSTPLAANRPVGLQNGDISEQDEVESPKFSIWKILTCKCS